MYIKSKLAKSIRLAMTLGLTSVVAFTANIASAQEQEANDEEEVIEKIRVTGSRIKRAGIDTIRPSIEVDASILEKNAFTNIADALNEVPVFGAGVTPNGDPNAFTVGSNFVNLFDLGSQRTLTLVNGRRFVSGNVPSNFGSAGGLQVDLNAIPVALLRGVEIVPLGGAAVYGSDAIAGVVNVTLRDDYEGFEISGQYGTSEEGDANTRQIQAVVGGNFDDGRGNATFAVEFNRQDGLLQADRPFFTNNPEFRNNGQLDLDGDGVNDDVNGDGLPDSFSRIQDGNRVLQILASGGLAFGLPGLAAVGGSPIPTFGIGAIGGEFLRFQPNGNLEACEPGQTDAASALFAVNSTCGDDFFDETNQIRSPLERVVFTALNHYDLTESGSVRFSQELNLANSQSVDLVNQGGFNGLFGGSSSILTFDATNPFLNDQAVGVLNAGGIGAGPDFATSQFGLSRFNNDIVAGGENSTENITWRYYGGFSGDFLLGGRDFSWDVGAVFGRAEVETRTTGIVDGRFFNAIDAVRLDDESLAPVLDFIQTNSVDANGDGFLDADGNQDGVLDITDAIGFFNQNGGSGVVAAGLGDIVCQTNINNSIGALVGANTPAGGNGSTDADLPFTTGCVPLNLFGDGAASAGALNFINGAPQLDNSDIEQRVITANIGGEIFDLPAGAVNVYVGYETRTETAQFSPGLGRTLPLTRSAPILGINGELETQEFYAETNIPIFSPDQGIPGARLAEFDASVRTVENEITGPDGSTNTTDNTVFELGFRYSPIEDVIFRATYAEAIRSPSLVELFTPNTQIFQAGNDPCDADFINQGPNPDVRRANCIASGVTDPDSFVSTIADATVIGSAEGNANLTPEESESFNIGLVIEPRWVDNLTITLDYFNIDISNRIENFSFQELAEACLDDPNFQTNPAEACNQFVRDPATNQVVDFTTINLNAATSEFAAFQYRLEYDFDIADALKLFNNNWGNTDYGNLDLNFQLLRRLRDTEQLTPTSEVVRDVGDFADPTHQGTFDFTWTKGPFRAFWRISYQDAAEFDIDGEQIFLDDDDNIITRGAPRFIHNASFQYEISEGFTAQLAANNVFSRNPKREDFADNHFNFVELIGTTYSLRIRKQF
jgi:outer membrane receptor protein involved in Fe transport